MTTENDKAYWDRRGTDAYEYKGETFYTVTPVPLYHRRRALLLQLLDPFLRPPDVVDVCDFGCGDGWYLGHFSEKYPGKRWYGVDLSETMIDRASRAVPNAWLEVSGEGVPFHKSFDLVCAVAVFAHVLGDAKARDLFANIASHLRPNAPFILFEQTGPQRRGGETWCRRNTQAYLDFATEAGLVVEDRRLIAYPAHRVFERWVAPVYRRFFTRGKNGHERCIRANRSRVYRGLSSIVLALSGNPVRSDDGTRQGNTFYVFRKPGKDGV